MDPQQRARTWWRSGLTTACDDVRPWEYGTIVRSHNCPDVYDLNAVIVEREPGPSAGELVAVADRELGECAHRKLYVEDPGEGQRLRGELDALGWNATVLVWMAFEG